MSRPLRPTYAAHHPPPSQSQFSGSSNNPNPPSDRPPGGPHKPTYAKRGKITIVACVPCRKRKTKCDGQRPACSQCRAREGNCMYDMTDDQRRLTFLRDNVEHLVEEKSALESLVSSLQSAPQDQALQTLERLRAPGEDVNAIAREIHASRPATETHQHGESSTSQAESSGTPERARTLSRTEQLDTLVKNMTRASAPELDEIIHPLRRNEDLPSILNDVSNENFVEQLPQSGDVAPGLERDYSARATTFGLVKGAAYQENSAPNAQTPLGQSPTWTTVTDDQEFINHLLDLYFAWQHSFFQSFPEDLFRRDYASGDTKYCSQLLVNAICAAGCALSDRQRARRDPNDCKTAGLDFQEEAIRLLNDQGNTPSIPTTAALFLLCHVEGNRGRLSPFWMYSGRSSRMALDLNLHLRIDVGDGEMSEGTRQQEFARRHAFWGCFISDQVTSFTLGRVPQIPTSAVTIEMPPIEEETDSRKWSSYDIPGPEKPGARSTTFNTCAALSKIVNSTLCMFFAPTRVISGRLLLDEYNKYLNWYERLPDLVSSIDDAPPHVLCLHMYYHAAVLLLFRPFLKAKFTESDISPRDVCRSSANAISDIFAQHRRMYGLAGLYTFQVHCLLTACTIHIINIPAIASTTYLTAASNSFQDMLPRNEWAASSLNIIRGLVQKWSIVLPLEAETALYRNADAFTRMEADVAAHNFDPRSPTVPPTGESFPDPNDPSSPSSKRPPPHFHHPSTSVLQKRQRLQPRPQLQNFRPSGETYLFAPFPNQPAPLLGPIHTSEGVQEEGTDGEEGDSLVERVARGFDGLNFDGDGMFDPFIGWNSRGPGEGSAFGRGI